MATGGHHHRQFIRNWLGDENRPEIASESQAKVNKATLQMAVEPHKPEMSLDLGHDTADRFSLPNTECMEALDKATRAPMASLMIWCEENNSEERSVEGEI